MRAGIIWRWGSCLRRSWVVGREIRDQKSEVRSQRSEVRGQKFFFLTVLFKRWKPFRNVVYEFVEGDAETEILNVYENGSLIEEAVREL
jgi:hypothetical protein